MAEPLAPAPALRISIKKKPDGSAALSLRRADGSVTWQRQEGIQGRCFPLHDLTHYAVETVLGLDQAFFGLVASGWGNPPEVREADLARIRALRGRLFDRWEALSPGAVMELGFPFDGR